MAPQKLAGIAAAAGFISIIGVVAPAVVARVYGLQLDGSGAALFILACASYVGLAALSWRARDLTDASAWRAIAAGNAGGWGFSAVVVALAILSGLGNPASWILIGIQLAFILAWALAYESVMRPAAPATSSTA